MYTVTFYSPSSIDDPETGLSFLKGTNVHRVYSEGELARVTAMLSSYGARVEVYDLNEGLPGTGTFSFEGNGHERQIEPTEDEYPSTFEPS